MKEEIELTHTKHSTKPLIVKTKDGKEEKQWWWKGKQYSYKEWPGLGIYLSKSREEEKSNTITTTKKRKTKNRKKKPQRLTAMQAIRKFCLKCVGHDKKEVKNCTDQTCELRVFRMGKRIEE